VFWHFFTFELGFRLKKISTLVYFLIFAAFSFFATISMGEAFPTSNFNVAEGGRGQILANAPYVMYFLIVAMTYFGMLVVSAICGNAGYRDFERNTHPLYFSYPISKFGYLGGRFAGSITVLLLIFSSIAIGAALGAVMPFVNAAKFAPVDPWVYVQPYLIGVLPNLIFAGSLFFALALLARRRLPVHVAAIGIFIGYLIAGNLVGDVENKFLGALIDPFGMAAGGVATEFWTPAEKNARLIPLVGATLWNRVLWSGLGLGVLAFAWWRFSFSALAVRSANKQQAAARSEVEPPPAAMAPPAPAAREFSTRHNLSQLLSLTRLEVAGIVKNLYFLVIVLLGVLFTLVVGWQNLGRIYDTNTHPVTYQVLELTAGMFAVFMLIIITLYAGELVWRERDKRVQQIFDALPIPDWLPFVSKLVALIVVQVTLLLVVMGCGVTLQLMHGYTKLELSLYLTELFGLRTWAFVQYCALAMLVQVLVNNKYLGHFFMIVFYILNAFLGRFGLEHRLYNFAGARSTPYSDMNGYGHFLGPHFVFVAYWTAFALLLVLLGLLFWVRGNETALGQRFRLARARVRRPHLIVAGVNLVLLLGVGGFIFYNTNILNTYRTSFESDELQAQYERLYKAHEKEPQPRITDVSVNIDIFPDERRLVARGRYTLANTRERPVSKVYVNLTERTDIRSLRFQPAARQVVADPERGLYAYELGEPLARGATMTLEFDLAYAPRGFANSGPTGRVMGNGTFVNNTEILPVLGYAPGRELEEDDTRRKHGLPPKERMAPVDDLAARMNNQVLQDSDWLNYEATVSTSADQIAVTSGYLQREWVEGGRRYFHYRMDAPMLGFYSFLSGRWQVKRDHWRDVGIEIYYHPGHEYNVDQMIAALQKSLEYYTREFGPYQHRIVRIIEFPRYATFAQSFANTIPYSEAIGFIAKVDPETVDYPFIVTAHELAHQWWAHQVIGGDVQGATMITEVMSQYAALQVARAEFGEKRTRKYLEYELASYLRGRGLERKKEVPLYLVENQGYIHYNKGVVAMNAFQDAVGPEKVNRALASFLGKYKYQQPPYTNTLELMPYLRQATPERVAYLPGDLFERITLWQSRAVSASARKRTDGRYDVTLRLEASKLQADEHGAEREVPINDWIDIAVLDKDGEPLYLRKHLIDKAQLELTVTVDKEPAQAGIDPYVKLIDRNRDDNLVKIGSDAAAEGEVGGGIGFTVKASRPS
jgi:ABC-2 type transport system permease protein